MDAMEKMGMDRENPYATTPPLRGHTYVPWTPDMCNVIGRQIKWVVTKSIGCGRYNGYVTKRDRENPCSATPPRRGHTYVPWVPGMWNGDEGRQTMKVITTRIDQTGLKHFGGAVAGLAATSEAHPRGCGGTHMAHHEYSAKASDSTAHCPDRGVCRCPGPSSP